MKTTTSLLNISWIILVLMGRGAFGACFDVKTFGAKGDGITDDHDAIQNAIDATVLSPHPVVCFPAGTYRVTHAIRPEHDNLTLQGGPGVTIVADPDMIHNATDFTYPEAILVNKGDPVEQVTGVTIQSLAIQVKAGRSSVVVPGHPAPTSTGAIQLNFCVNCVVSNVTITYTGPASTPRETSTVSPHPKEPRAGFRAWWFRIFPKLGSTCPTARTISSWISAK